MNKYCVVRSSKYGIKVDVFDNPEDGEAFYNKFAPEFDCEDVEASYIYEDSIAEYVLDEITYIKLLVGNLHEDSTENKFTVEESEKLVDSLMNAERPEKKPDYICKSIDDLKYEIINAINSGVKYSRWKLNGIWFSINRPDQCALIYLLNESTGHSVGISETPGHLGRDIEFLLNTER